MLKKGKGKKKEGRKKSVPEKRNCEFVEDRKKANSFQFVPRTFPSSFSSFSSFLSFSPLFFFSLHLQLLPNLTQLRTLFFSYFLTVDTPFDTPFDTPVTSSQLPSSCQDNAGIFILLYLPSLFGQRPQRADVL